MTTKKTNFENLEIYTLSEQLADSVWEIVLKWNNLAQDTVGKQLIRSADSVGANIAEGSGRAASKTIGDLFELLEAHLTKLATGCGDYSEESC